MKPDINRRTLLAAIAATPWVAVGQNVTAFSQSPAFDSELRDVYAHWDFMMGVEPSAYLLEHSTSLQSKTALQRQIAQQVQDGDILEIHGLELSHIEAAILANLVKG